MHWHNTLLMYAMDDDEDDDRNNCHLATVCLFWFYK